MSRVVEEEVEGIGLGSWSLGSLGSVLEFNLISRV